MPSVKTGSDVLLPSNATDVIGFSRVILHHDCNSRFRAKLNLFCLLHGDLETATFNKKVLLSLLIFTMEALECWGSVKYTGVHTGSCPWREGRLVIMKKKPLTWNCKLFFSFDRTSEFAHDITCDTLGRLPFNIQSMPKRGQMVVPFAMGTTLYIKIDPSDWQQKDSLLKLARILISTRNGQDFSLFKLGQRNPILPKENLVSSSKGSWGDKRFEHPSESSHHHHDDPSYWNGRGSPSKNGRRKWEGDSQHFSPRYENTLYPRHSCHNFERNYDTRKYDIHRRPSYSPKKSHWKHNKRRNSYPSQWSHGVKSPNKNNRYFNGKRSLTRHNSSGNQFTRIRNRSQEGLHSSERERNFYCSPEYPSHPSFLEQKKELYLKSSQNKSRQLIEQSEKENYNSSQNYSLSVVNRFYGRNASKSPLQPSPKLLSDVCNQPQSDAKSPKTNHRKRICLTLGNTPPKKNKLNSLTSVSEDKENENVVCPRNQGGKLMGFSNLGNTCYMNAVLQALFALEPFTEDLLHSERKIGKYMPKGTLYRCIIQLLYARHQSDNSSEDTSCSLLRCVKQAIEESTKSFSGNEMQDAHELLTKLLDQLKEDTERANKQVASIDKSSKSLIADARLFINPVKQNFEFEFLESYRCTKCNEVIPKHQVYYDLSLDLQDSRTSIYVKSIKEALSNYFSAEKVDYKCAKCNHNESQHIIKFSHLPRVLAIHLKRYKYSHNSPEKIDRPVFIHRSLNLKDHCLPETLPPTPLVWSSKNANSILINEDDHQVVPESSCSLPLKPSSKKPVSHSQDILTSPFVNNSDESKSSLAVSKERKTSYAIPIQSNDLDKPFNHWETNDDLGNCLNGNANNEVFLSFRGSSSLHSSNSSHIPFREHTAIGLKGGQPQLVLDLSGVENTCEEPKKTDADELLSAEELPSIDREIEQETVKDHFAEAPTTKEEEEKHLQEAMSNSLIDEEDDEVQKAKMLSLQEYSQWDITTSTAESDETELSKNEFPLHIEDCDINAETDVNHSYQLVSVVNHIGSMVNRGHYITDTYDTKKKKWFNFDDLEVKEISESIIRNQRQTSDKEKQKEVADGIKLNDDDNEVLLRITNKTV